MITLRRAEERERVPRRKSEAWLTFPPPGRTPLQASGFGALRVFEEGRLPPQTAYRQPILEEAEIITYVRGGTLVYEDSTGRSGLISAGEFQRMTHGRGVRYGETNSSPTDWAHVFQLWLRPSVVGLGPGHEQKRFSVAQRRGVLCVVASPDGQHGSLRIHQNACLYSAILNRGQHVIHELVDRRCAWLHIVQGAVRCGETAMATGDGAGIEAEPAVSLSATEETEILLLDLGEFASTGSPSEAREEGC
jgi:quercetin 2,3-dioxygenase